MSTHTRTYKTPIIAPTVSALLKNAARKRHLSAILLANELQLSYHQVCDTLNGTQDKWADARNRIAVYLGISPFTLQNAIDADQRERFKLTPPPAPAPEAPPQVPEPQEPSAYVTFELADVWDGLITIHRDDVVMVEDLRERENSSRIYTRGDHIMAVQASRAQVLRAFGIEEKLCRP